MDAASRGIGWQGRTAIPYRSDDVEEATQNRISDWNRNGCTGRAHLRVAREAGGCLKRDAADRRRIDVAVHFEDQRFGPIPFDNQGGVNRRKRIAVETHVNDRASNRNDRSH